MPQPQRRLRLEIRISVEEDAMLQELAEASGLSVSDVIRQMTRHSHRAYRKLLQKEAAKVAQESLPATPPATA